mmetsp:Transcript_19101/g.67929  ORF Transcript_19101/g.67929 Transcript_19101/m.67929 type:complete len:325 (+) Transcript_19101:25-999(+)
MVGQQCLVVADTPDTDGVVGVTGVQGGAVGGPGDAGALGLHGLLLDLGDELGNDVLVLQIPDADARLGGSAEPVAVGGEADLVDGLSALKLVQVLTAGEVPQLGGSVFAGGGAQAAVGGDGHGAHVAGVALQGVEAAELAEGPDLDGVVPGAGHDQGGLRGGGEANAAHPVGVAVTLHGEHALTLDVPHLEGVVPTAGDDLAVVGGEGDGGHVLGVAVELADGVTGLQVPEAEGAIPGGGQRELSVVGQGDVLDKAGVAFEATAGGGVLVLDGVAVLGSLPGDKGVVPRSGHNLDGGVVGLGAGEGRDPSAVSLKLTFVCHSHC